MGVPIHVISYNLPLEVVHILTWICSMISEKVYKTIKKICLLIRNIFSLNTTHNMFKKYPLLYKRLDDIGRMELSNGKIPKCDKMFFLQLIDFCITYFKNLPLRQESDYRSMKKEEDVNVRMLPSLEYQQEASKISSRSERGQK